MGYRSLATTIINKKFTLETAIQNIESISFDSVWSGGAHDKLTGDLKKIIESIKEQSSNIDTFVAALQYLQSYKDNRENQMTIQKILNSTPNTSENSEIITSLVSQSNNLSTNNNYLRQTINSLLTSLTTTSSIVEPINYTISDNEGYILDINEFHELFENNDLTKLPDSGKSSLYDYYTEEQVEQKLAEIKSMYSGRDAAVNCALGVMQMAADAGLKLDYDWGGGHTAVTENSAVASGVDCSAFASWAINQGSTETFNTRTTSGLINVGERVDYSQAQKGDILVYNTSDSGHVVLIVENNPETETFLVAEANGSNSGVIMKERTYSSLKSNSYQARDLTTIYNN